MSLGRDWHPSLQFEALDDSGHPRRKVAVLLVSFDRECELHAMVSEYPDFILLQITRTRILILCGTRFML